MSPKTEAMSPDSAGMDSVDMIPAGKDTSIASIAMQPFERQEIDTSAFNDYDPLILALKRYTVLTCQVLPPIFRHPSQYGMLDTERIRQVYGCGPWGSLTHEGHSDSIFSLSCLRI